jgi:electron transfer flavoprotein alpha/beta subunit
MNSMVGLILKHFNFTHSKDLPAIFNSQKEINKIQTAEMRFLRKAKECTRLDRIRNEDIGAELNNCSINERITDYQNR